MGWDGGEKKKKIIKVMYWVQMGPMVAVAEVQKV